MEDLHNKPYVFISYAHADSAVVLPILNALKSGGINLWFDEGIEAGSEWPEYIAEKVVACSKFVLFISPAYLQSQNCKRELNFAISRKKDILSVYIADVNLSPGMEMQLGTYQAVFRNRYSDINALSRALCAESFFVPCKQNGMTGNAVASAPTQTVSVATSVTSAVVPPATSAAVRQQPFPVRKRLVAGLLAIFLGGLGIHKFYLRQPWLGVLMLFLSFVAKIPIVGLIGIVEGICILRCKKDRLQKWYKKCVIVG